jgi:hypothetical protein
MRIQLIWAGAPNIKSTSMNLAWQRENFANGVILRFMDLSYEEVSYFIQQVGLSAASFGVATDDVQAVGMALGKAFNYRCAPPMTVVPSQGMQLQSICQQADCPLSPNATCAAYGNSTQPSIAVSSLVPTNTASGTATPLASASKTSGTGGTTTGTSPATASKAAAAGVGMSLAAIAGGVIAMFL